MKLNIQLFADGEIVIETKVDTSGVEEGLEGIDKALQNQQNMEEMWAKTFEDSGDSVKLVSRNVEEITDELELMYNELEESALLYREMKNQKVISGEDLQYAEELRQKIIDISNKIYNETGVMPLVKGITDVNRELPKTNLHLSSILKKIGRWGVALFGIRSIYGLISSTASKIGQQNEEIGAKLQAIKGSITNLLAPVVEVIVNLVYRLLSYLNVITKTFFGIDLFAKSAKSAKSAVGSAQKLRKTLAGFDEMNILNDNVSGGGGGGGVETPQIEPPNMDKWQKVVDNIKAKYQEILKTDRNAKKEMLLSSDKTFGYFKLGWFDYVQGTVIQIQGLIDFFAGIYDTLVGLSEDNNEKIKAGIIRTLNGIAENILGLGQKIHGMYEMIVGLGASLGTSIRKVFSNIGVDISKWASEQYRAISSTFTSIGSKVGEWVGNSLKSIINSVLSYINKKINGYIDNLNSAISVVNKLGLNVKKISHITLPKLAKGGIVNMPSKGVPVGSAITGESGAEGVIPLTDSQQMALLGEAIGRYITINANIVNTMNGRVISRELQKIQQESSFASNR